jgi:hypothetical protein
MSRDEIIRMARRAGAHDDGNEVRFVELRYLERFAALVADAEAKRMHAEGMVTVGYMRQQIAAERNKVASWMMAQGYATGHGDTTEDLLKELEWQVRESEREACAAVARQWDADHPASNYGGCIANLIEARGQDAA